jgi:(p)ppGpp synthase/HD superfamily hydrolase
MTELRRPLSNQFKAALNLAHRVHRHQARKGSGGTVPYIAHVLAVTALVLENGGTETQPWARYCTTPSKTRPIHPAANP